MKLTRVFAFSLIAASLGLSVVHAQSRSALNAPAEYPSSSYKGKQYVDSRGCVYIRAGVDGSVTWVPRVTRDRKVICGFKPTTGAATTANAPAPKLDKNVVQIQPATAPTGGTATAAKPPASTATTPKPATTKSTAAAPKKAAPRTTTSSTAKTTTRTTAPAKTTTRTTAAAAPAPKATAPKTTVRKTTVRAPSGDPAPTTFSSTSATAATPAPKATGVTPTYKSSTKTRSTSAGPSGAPAPTTFSSTQPTAAPAPQPVPQTRRTTTQAPRAAGSLSPCRNGVATHKGHTVRCGPQSQSPVTPGSGSPTAAPPKMQFDQQSALPRGTVGQVVRIGEVHPETRVVPRHVYEANLNNHVRQDVPEGYRRAFDDGRLNTRRAEMTFAGVTQTNRLWTEKVPRRLIDRRTGEEIVVSSKLTSTTYGTPLASDSVARSAYAPAMAPVAPVSPVVSTKSTSSDKALRLTGTPYVQVGTYSSAQQAQSVAQDVKRLGLPVRIGKYTRNGSTRRIVLAGPFASADAAGQALSKTQGAGFNSAYLRQ